MSYDAPNNRVKVDVYNGMNLHVISAVSALINTCAHALGDRRPARTHRVRFGSTALGRSGALWARVRQGADHMTRSTAFAHLQGKEVVTYPQDGKMSCEAYSTGSGPYSQNQIRTPGGSTNGVVDAVSGAPRAPVDARPQEQRTSPPALSPPPSPAPLRSPCPT